MIGAPPVHLHRHLGEHPVTGTVLRLHQGDVVGARGPVGHEHELGAGGVGTAHAPRGPQVVVEGACSAVLGAGDAAVAGRVDGAAVLFDDGARVVAGTREHVEPEVEPGRVGEGLAGAFRRALVVADGREPVLGAPAVGVGDDQVGVTPQRRCELGVGQVGGLRG